MLLMRIFSQVFPTLRQFTGDVLYPDDIAGAPSRLDPRCRHSIGGISPRQSRRAMRFRKRLVPTPIARKIARVP